MLYPLNRVNRLTPSPWSGFVLSRVEGRPSAVVGGKVCRAARESLKQLEGSQL